VILFGGGGGGVVKVLIGMQEKGAYISFTLKKE